MESFITVPYETTRITFQSRGSESLLGFKEGHPHSKNHVASKISKSWLGEKKCKNANNFKILKHWGCIFNQNKLCIKTVRLF